MMFLKPTEEYKVGIITGPRYTIRTFEHGVYAELWCDGGRQSDCVVKVEDVLGAIDKEREDINDQMARLALRESKLNSIFQMIHQGPIQLPLNKINE